MGARYLAMDLRSSGVFFMPILSLILSCTALASKDDMYLYCFLSLNAYTVHLPLFWGEESMEPDSKVKSLITH